jgi:hypothetical protein
MPRRFISLTASFPAGEMPPQRGLPTPDVPSGSSVMAASAYGLWQLWVRVAYLTPRL